MKTNYHKNNHYIPANTFKFREKTTSTRVMMPGTNLVHVKSNQELRSFCRSLRSKFSSFTGQINHTLNLSALVGFFQAIGKSRILIALKRKVRLGNEIMERYQNVVKGWLDESGEEFYNQVDDFVNYQYLDANNNESESEGFSPFRKFRNNMEARAESFFSNLNRSILQRFEKFLLGLSASIPVSIHSPELHIPELVVVNPEEILTNKPVLNRRSKSIRAVRATKTRHYPIWIHSHVSSLGRKIPSIKMGSWLRSGFEKLVGMSKRVKNISDETRVIQLQVIKIISTGKLNVFSQPILKWKERDTCKRMNAQCLSIMSDFFPFIPNRSFSDSFKIT